MVDEDNKKEIIIEDTAECACGDKCTCQESKNEENCACQESKNEENCACQDSCKCHQDEKFEKKDRKLFKKYNGISPWDYIHIKRIEMAVDLLKNSKEILEYFGTNSRKELANRVFNNNYNINIKKEV